MFICILKKTELIQFSLNGFATYVFRDGMRYQAEICVRIK